MAAPGTVSHITDQAFFRSAPKVLYCATTDITLLDDIAFSIDAASLAKRLRIKPGSPRLRELQELVNQAQPLGRPKAMYGFAYVESRGDDYMVVEGVQPRSRVLRVNSGRAQGVFPCVFTRGIKLGFGLDPRQLPH